MKSFSIALVSLVTFTTGPAIAQDGPAAPQPPAPEKKICRAIVPTGSIMGKRICLTKAEWKEFNQLNQDDADSALSKKVNVGPRELNK